eukprot:10902_1
MDFSAIQQISTPRCRITFPFFKNSIAKKTASSTPLIYANIQRNRIHIVSDKSVKAVLQFPRDLVSISVSSQDCVFALDGAGNVFCVNVREELPNFCDTENRTPSKRSENTGRLNLKKR